MSAPIPDDPDDADGRVLAGEYALGLLEGQARLDALERMDADPAFRRAVDAWRRRFAPMLADVAPASPSPAVWDAIAGSISPAPVLSFRPRPRLFNNLTAWRAATAASMVAAAACLALILLRPASPPASMMVATLTDSQGRPLYVATFNRGHSGVTVVTVGDVKANGRSPELWIIAAGGKPQPIGLIRDSHPLALAASAAARSGASAQAILAVSLEPAGGSPTGAPTGPVIATGALKPVQS